MAKGNNGQRNDGNREEDKDFAIFLGAAKNVDFVAASERARVKTIERLISLTIENAEAKQEKIDLAAVEQRIKALFDESEKRSWALLRVIDEQGEERARQILGDIEKLCTFFFVIFYGWKQARQTFGRWKIDKLMKEVRQRCPAEIALYRRAWRDCREARRRLLATESVQSWRWYTTGKGNKNSVAYRTKVDLSRQAESHFRNRRLMKYMSHEVLSRKAERRRARKELRDSQIAMMAARQRVYQKMGIPLDLV